MARKFLKIIFIICIFTVSSVNVYQSRFLSSIRNFLFEMLSSFRCYLVLVGSDMIFSLPYLLDASTFSLLFWSDIIGMFLAKLKWSVKGRLTQIYPEQVLSNPHRVQILKVNAIIIMSKTVFIHNPRAKDTQIRPNLARRALPCNGKIQ